MTMVDLAGLARTVALAATIWLAIGGAIVLARLAAGIRYPQMMPDADRAERVALAGRDAVRVIVVLACLADGRLATNAELRWAVGYAGDSFRSLGRRQIGARACRSSSLASASSSAEYCISRR